MAVSPEMTFSFPFQPLFKVVQSSVPKKDIFLNRSDCDCCNDLEFIQHESSVLDPLITMFIAYVVRALYVLVEFGPRALKTVKRIVSCGLGCLILCQMSTNQRFHYGNTSWDTPTCGTLLMVFFLVLKLTLKILTLLNLFKTRKKLRIIKLLKLTK